ASRLEPAIDDAELPRSILQAIGAAAAGCASAAAGRAGRSRKSELARSGGCNPRRYVSTSRRACAHRAVDGRDARAAHHTNIRAALPRMRLRSRRRAILDL